MVAVLLLLTNNKYTIILCQLIGFIYDDDELIIDLIKAFSICKIVRKHNARIFNKKFHSGILILFQCN